MDYMNRKILKLVYPILLGALGGFLYYNFVGCNNGCAITGNPYISTLYGTGIGAVLVNWKPGLSSVRNNKQLENGKK